MFYYNLFTLLELLSYTVSQQVFPEEHFDDCC